MKETALEIIVPALIYAITATFFIFIGGYSARSDTERDCLRHHQVTLNGTTFACEIKEE